MNKRPPIQHRLQFKKQVWPVSTLKWMGELLDYPSNSFYSNMLSHYLKNHIGQFWNDVICEQPLKRNIQIPFFHLNQFLTKHRHRERYFIWQMVTNTSRFDVWGFCSFILSETNTVLYLECKSCLDTYSSPLHCRENIVIHWYTLKY